MRESLFLQDKDLILRETFQSFAQIAKNRGVATDITIGNGIAEFNGTTSKILYPTNTDIVNGLSYRFKFDTPFGLVSPSYLFAHTDNNNYGVYVSRAGVNFYAVYISSSGNYFGLYTSSYSSLVANAKELTVVFGASYSSANSAIYVNGVVIAVSSFDLGSPGKLQLNTLKLGTNLSGTVSYAQDMDLVEVYKGRATASQVYNWYHGLTNVEVPIKTSTLISLAETTFHKGYLEDRCIGINYGAGIRPTPTLSEVTFKKIGQYSAAVFNGTPTSGTSKIDNGCDFIGTKEITVMGWIFPTGEGEGTITLDNAIIDNGKFMLYHYSYSGSSRIDAINFSSNGGVTTVTSTIGSVKLRQLTFFAITRTAAGVTNIYIGNMNTYPALNGAADQSSGTPAAGTTNVIYGNNNAGTATLNGMIPMLSLKEGVVDINTISEYFSNTKRILEGK